MAPTRTVTKSPRGVAPATMARELLGVANLINRAIKLVIESRSGDLESFAAALLTLQNAHVLLTGFAQQLGAKGGAE